MTHSVDIFYKSYSKDFWLLYMSLETLKKNVTGYNQVIILIPESEKELFDTSSLPDRTLVYYVREYGQGWLLQQWYKASAYKYCFAEFIMFSDSDCFFDKPINVHDVVATGRPEILYTSWDKVDQAIVWKKPTEALMGEEVPWEFMRRLPLTYYRATLENISKWEPNLELLIMGSARFSEFNLFGAYAFKYEKDNYTFINTDDWTYVDPLSIQVWSHASKKAGVSETHLREYIRTLETILKSNGIKIPNE